MSAVVQISVYLMEKFIDIFGASTVGEVWGRKLIRNMTWSVKKKAGLLPAASGQLLL